MLADKLLFVARLVIPPEYNSRPTYPVRRIGRFVKGLVSRNITLYQMSVHMYHIECPYAYRKKMKLDHMITPVQNNHVRSWLF